MAIGGVGAGRAMTKAAKSGREAAAEVDRRASHGRRVAEGRGGECKRGRKEKSSSIGLEKEAPLHVSRERGQVAFSEGAERV